MGFLGIVGFRGCAEGKGLQARTHNRPGTSSFPLLGNTGGPVVLRGQRGRASASGDGQDSFESVAERNQR